MNIRQAPGTHTFVIYWKGAHYWVTAKNRKQANLVFASRLIRGEI